jgi:uncharacterized protein
VLEVDLPRKRIALTMKLGAATQPRRNVSEPNRRATGDASRGGMRSAPTAPATTAMASAFARLKG